MKKLVVIFLILFVYLMVVINSCEVDEDIPIEEFTTEEFSLEACNESQTDFITRRTTNRSWIDFKKLAYCLTYDTDKNEYDKSRRYRNSHYIEDTYYYNSFWGKLYQNLYNSDKNKIDNLIDTLKSIQEDEKLSRLDFANMVVSFVQDIPYVFVLDQERCKDQEGDYDCITGQRFGILSPIEFLHTLKGDCDTRTVLLYTIFRKFNYSPKIVVSDAYAHSMLLLDVPSTGDYMPYQGQRFYFWETTSTGWEAGFIPPGMNNINKWKIVLY